MGDGEGFVAGGAFVAGWVACGLLIAFAPGLDLATLFVLPITAS